MKSIGLLTALVSLAPFAMAENLCSMGTSGGGAYRTFWIKADLLQEKSQEVCAKLISGRESKGKGDLNQGT
jgi:hypothetical protein